MIMVTLLKLAFFYHGVTRGIFRYLEAQGNGEIENEQSVTTSIALLGEKYPPDLLGIQIWEN